MTTNINIFINFHFTLPGTFQALIDYVVYLMSFRIAAFPVIIAVLILVSYIIYLENVRKED